MILTAANARAWLLAIVRNTCYTRPGRNRSQDLHTSFDEEVYSGREGLPSPETQLIENADRQLLKATLDELPVEFRKVVILRELEGLSYKEIVDVAGVPDRNGHVSPGARADGSRSASQERFCLDLQRSQSWIDGYVDRELDLVRSMEIERHIEGCPSCSKLYRNHLALRSAMRDGSLYFRAPAALEEQIRSAVRREGKAERHEQRLSWRLSWRWITAPIAASIVAGLPRFSLCPVRLPMICWRRMFLRATWVR